MLSWWITISYFVIQINHRGTQIYIRLKNVTPVFCTSNHGNEKKPETEWNMCIACGKYNLSFHQIFIKDCYTKLIEHSYVTHEGLYHLLVWTFKIIVFKRNKLKGVTIAKIQTNRSCCMGIITLFTGCNSMDTVLLILFSSTLL